MLSRAVVAKELEQTLRLLISKGLYAATQLIGRETIYTPNFLSNLFTTYLHTHYYYYKNALCYSINLFQILYKRLHL